MKRNVLGLALMAAVIACGKKDITPLTERIRKVWTASMVRESGTTVYSKEGTTNLRPGYTNFSLDLSQEGTVVLHEFDGTSFTGQWELSSDEKLLLLKGLTPQPTGTNGNLEYTIDQLTDRQLTLTRTTLSAKTGSAVSTYELIVR